MGGGAPGSAVARAHMRRVSCCRSSAAPPYWRGMRACRAVEASGVAGSERGARVLAASAAGGAATARVRYAPRPRVKRVHHATARRARKGQAGSVCCLYEAQVCHARRGRGSHAIVRLCSESVRQAGRHKRSAYMSSRERECSVVTGRGLPPFAAGMAKRNIYEC